MLEVEGAMEEVQSVSSLPDKFLEYIFEKEDLIQGF